ncbi:Cytochrome P450 [Streptoalloteichus tenebrarius]|uniref:Cytochrome P450 n=1 Tax=Streptoalloteichus tenebrarius (strain ATCC 17920 / DSM 40477 / JCM 4838 / CBS 697.72 / NBRC 16177 / NCIMB 11028 / NRRL B-12390 / A12253. 1 / ISP 5477) TaxID=1933 RepID=A0ABT1HMC7_STRSD|nr:cytochrome P450 [Streptoalloteichus tenebrarius]MCP2256668.1 Cytochrome P450 [Streptoalloteichus tenebrarius]BFF05023.1 cytochrome P450 [Streptoalloteichus tenebrarius]
MATGNPPADALRRFPFPQPSPLVPPPALAACRLLAPVSRVRLADGQVAWLVTRYADIRAVLTSPDFTLHVPRPSQDDATSSRSEFMLTDDNAKHHRLRQVVGPAFSLSRVERLRPRVREIVAGLLAAMTGRGPTADLMDSLALPLPLTVVCEVLGVPVPEWSRARHWASICLGDTAETGDERALAAFQDVEDHVTELIATRRDRATGVLGRLVRAAGEGRLSEGELHSMVTGLLLAGYLTTSSTIGVGTLVLLLNPDQWDALAHDRALVGSAVEEILRFRLTGTEISTQHRALADVTVSGVLVRRGELVVTPLVAANRDPDQFDDADRFVVARTDNAHLSFGLGTHYCLGAALARIELQEAIGALVDTLPGLRLAVPVEDLPWNTSGAEVDLRALPVTW